MDNERIDEYQLSKPESKDSLIDVKNKNVSNGKMKLSLLVLLRIFIMVVAAILCWTCNTDANMYMRILYTVLAVIFAEFYVLYYSFYHVFMGVKC